MKKARYTGLLFHFNIICGLNFRLMGSNFNLKTPMHKAGSHGFRGFRNTYLRNHTDCPPGLRKHWLGHAGRDMNDLYDKIKEETGFRKSWVAKAGIGFELPSLICIFFPRVPQKSPQAVGQSHTPRTANARLHRRKRRES